MLVRVHRKNGTIIFDKKDYDFLIKKGFGFSVNVKKNSKTNYIAVYAEKAGVKTPVARIILGIKKRSLVVDHINRNSLDNRRSNLRACTRSQNRMNGGKIRPGTSIYRGVYRSRGSRSFTAELIINGRKVYLGRHKTENLAAIAYNKAATKFFKEFACLNEIKGEGA